MKVISYSSVVMFLVVTERKNRGDVAFSQSFMARAAGVSHVTWGRLERGEGVYGLDYVATAANALGVTFLELVQATDYLCSLLVKNNELVIIGYGYTTYADVPEEPTRAAHDELQELLWKEREGRALFELSHKFGGLLGACLTYIQSPTQFAARYQRTQDSN